MSLFQRAHFETLVGGLPAATLVRQWGDASVGKVGGKIFAVLSWPADGPAISFKCSEMALLLLPDVEGVRPAPYLHRAGWMQALEGCALTTDELQGYIRFAHGLVAARLTRRVRAELGL